MALVTATALALFLRRSRAGGRATGDGPEHARGAQIDALDAQLDALHRHTTEADLAIVHLDEEVAIAKRRVPFRIDLGSLAVTLVFLWFGAAQFALLRACWRLVRRKASRTGRPDTIVTLNRHVDTLQSQLLELKRAVNQPR